MFKVTIACVVINLIILVSCATDHSLDDESELIEYERSFHKSNMTSLSHQIKDAISFITQFVDDTNGYITKGCSTKQSILSSIINKLIKSIVIKSIIREKENLALKTIAELPSIYHRFSDTTLITEFKLKNISLKGLDTLTINKLEYNACKLFNEINISLSNIEIAAIYTLNGTINNSPISGAGKLTLNAESVTFYEKSYMRCKSTISKEDCKLVNVNETVDIGAEKVMINLSGVQYKNLSDSTINHEFNHYINKYLKSNKIDLKEIMAEIFRDFKKKYMNSSPIKMLIKIKEYLMQILKRMNKRGIFGILSMVGDIALSLIL